MAVVLEQAVGGAVLMLDCAGENVEGKGKDGKGARWCFCAKERRW
jgi:hypothetical protein